MPKSRKPHLLSSIDRALVTHVTTFLQNAPIAGSTDSAVDAAVDHITANVPAFAVAPGLRSSVLKIVHYHNKSGRGSPGSPTAYDKQSHKPLARSSSAAAEDSSSEEEATRLGVELVQLEDSNRMNSSMRNLYGTPAAKAAPPVAATPIMPVPLVSPVGAADPASPAPLSASSDKSLPRKKRKRVPTDMAGASSDGLASGWKPEISRPTLKYKDLGGIEAILQEVKELIEYPFSHPELYYHVGVDIPRGVLLHGPPGCGKTMLVNAIAGELEVAFIKISAPEIVSGMSGESEAKLRTLFQEAAANAPCLLFIDEIDAITPKRESAQREMERRIVAQLLTCMDSLCAKERQASGMASAGPGGHPAPVIVVGATNRPDALDSALRRAGRFDREIAMGIPDDASRARILQVMCKGMRVAADCDFRAITRKTVGYVGADLAALTREAAVIAVNRIFTRELPLLLTSPTASGETADGAAAANSSNSMAIEVDGAPLSSPTASTTTTSGTSASASASASVTSASVDEAMLQANEAAALRRQRDSTHAVTLRARSDASSLLRANTAPLTAEQMAPLFVTQGDFEEAIKKVQPSAKREGFATIPDVSWSDVGALDQLREDLSLAILQPILYPDLFKSLGLGTPVGVLLYGPPGCGKTLVAKAIANESGASFLSIKGPELLNQYVGQSERAVRQVFQRARSSAPCIIFFDELDALCPRRSSSSEGSHVSERVVNQLLTEMDGLDERRQVFVIAATNRPDIIDPAMLRPGRLDKMLYVRLPDKEGRTAIMKQHSRQCPLAPDVRLDIIAEDRFTAGFSGADCAALIREGTVQALREVQKKTFAAVNADGAPAGRAQLPDGGIFVYQRHFAEALKKVAPSVSPKTVARYDKMQQLLTSARGLNSASDGLLTASASAADGDVVAPAVAPDAAALT